MDIVIIYHSGYGHTKKLAQAVYEGIQNAGVTTELIEIDQDGNVPQPTWDAIVKAKAVIFGSPTYMGSASWQFKKFADASSKPWYSEAWKDKLATGFTNSASMNGDKHSTIHFFITLAMQHGMLWAGCGMLPSNKKASTRNDINYMGAYAGLMSQSPSDASPDEGPLPGDLQTAQLFGKRIANLVLNKLK